MIVPGMVSHVFLPPGAIFASSLSIAMSYSVSSHASSGESRV